MSGGKNFDFERGVTKVNRPRKARAAPAVRRPRPVVYREKVEGRDGDFGYWMERGIERADREEREARPWVKWRSAYLSIVGENPDIDPWDHDGAQLKLGKVEEALKHGGWTRNEWRRLHQMHRKWKMRVEGRDWRFAILGSGSGSGRTRGRELTPADQARLAIGRLLAVVRKEGERIREGSEA